MNSEVQVLEKSRDETRIQTVLEITMTREYEPSPSLAECRYGVLGIHDSKTTGEPGYVVYDRLLSRIVDGVYYNQDSALDVARLYNEHSKPDGSCASTGTGDRSPNSIALGLIYPDPPVFPDK